MTHAPPHMKRAARVAPETARETAADTANSTTPHHNAQSGKTALPEYCVSWHAFVAWAVGQGYAPTTRMVDAIIDELEAETI
jgi:hypothetical protein